MGSSERNQDSCTQLREIAMIRLFTFLVLASIIATQAEEGMCINGWKTFNDRCYYFSGYKKSWNASENKCSELHPKAHLVSIVSKEEHEFISNNTGTSITWIGGNDIDAEGNWTWSDGRPWGYFKWHSDEPNNIRNEDCLVEWNNFWWDNPCNRNWPFVCSYALPDHCQPFVKSDYIVGYTGKYNRTEIKSGGRWVYKNSYDGEWFLWFNVNWKVDTRVSFEGAYNPLGRMYIFSNASDPWDLGPWYGWVTQDDTGLSEVGTVTCA